MKRFFKIISLILLSLNLFGPLYGQAYQGESVQFILKEDQSDVPISGATYSLKCGIPELDDHRGTPSDAFQTIPYPPLTELHYIIERKGYKTKSGTFVVQSMKSKNVQIVYMERYLTPIRPRIQLEGTLYYMNGDTKALVSGEQVTIKGLMNTKSVQSGDLGRYQISFDVDEILDKEVGYSISVCKDSYVFDVVDTTISSSDPQEFVDFELVPFSKDAALAFRLYDPETRSNVADARVQVLVEGKVIAESTTDENGNVSINPEIEPGVKRVTVTIHKEGVLNFSFKVPTAEINSPYVINEHLKNDFDQRAGSHLIQFGLGASAGPAGESHMVLLEAYTGVGRSSTIFGGVSWTPYWVKQEFFPSSASKVHPDSCLSQYPLNIIYKQYLVAPSKLGVDMFWGWFFSFKTKGPGDLRNLYWGDGAFVGARYSFVKNFAAEARVMVNNSIWNYKNRGYWDVTNERGLNFQFTLNYTLPK